jgi:hypothetical protein
MKRAVVVLCGLLGLAAVAAEERPYLKSLPPEIARVEEADRAEGTITIQYARAVPQTREILDADGGKKERVTELRVVPVTQRLRVKGFRVLDMKGKEIEGGDVWKRLTPGTMILRQAGEIAVDPAYLKVFSPDAVLLAPRPEKRRPD